MESQQDRENGPRDISRRSAVLLLAAAAAAPVTAWADGAPAGPATPVPPTTGPAAPTQPTDPTAPSDSSTPAGPMLGSGDTLISGDAVTIDGVTVSRADFDAALPRMLRAPEGSPQTQDLAETAGLVVGTAQAGGGLVGLGQGVAGVFQRIAYELGLANLSSDGDGTVYWIKKGAIALGDKDKDKQCVPSHGMAVVFTSGAVVVNGTAMGYNWLSYDLVDYVTSHSDIEVFSPEEWSEMMW